VRSAYLELTDNSKKSLIRDQGNDVPI